MLEFVKKNKWIELEQIIWFGDKLKFGLYLKKIKETEFKHSILAQLDLITTLAQSYHSLHRKEKIQLPVSPWMGNWARAEWYFLGAQENTVQKGQKKT
jgi:hypothetical protein